MSKPRSARETVHHDSARRQGSHGRRWQQVTLGLALVLWMAAPALAGPGGDTNRSRGATPFFSENVGQLDNSDVRFYLDAGGLDVGLTDDAILYVLREPTPRDARGRVPDVGSQPGAEPAMATRRGVLVRVSFEGANRVRPEGVPDCSEFATFGRVARTVRRGAGDVRARVKIRVRTESSARGRRL